MGDSARFRLFADLIAERFPDRSLKIADVASGNGQLQAELRQRGFEHIESWDTRHRNAKNRRGYRFGRFDYRSASRHYDLVVGMHPDEGTDQIVAYAAKHRCPFVVCPCCVLPSALPFEGVGYDGWVSHLAAIAEPRRMRVDRLEIPMTGRRIVLVGDRL
jgi:hypothetical protein